MSADEKEVLESGTPIQFEDVPVVGDGERRTMLSTKFPLLNAAGKPYAVGGISTDITDRKKAEEAVREKNAELQKTLEELKMEGAVGSMGGCLEDVVRTRVYIRDTSMWEAVARVHGERFGHILPANTMIQAGLIGDEYLIEIEAEAVVA